MTTVGQPNICTRILGGLGNQMFQYAAGLSLAHHVNGRLHLDLSAFRGYELRAYALSAFNVRFDEYAQTRPRSEIIQTYLSKLVGRSIGQPRYYGLPWVIEPSFHFWDKFYAQSGSCYLDGYWQSPLYFKHVESLIRQTFDLGRFSNARTQPFEKLIRQARQPVAVHLRRGDYISNPQFRLVHGICEQEYYDRARQVIEKVVNPSHFFIFSDDIDIARKEFSHWPNTTFVSGLSQEEDMMLIATCQHAIIANSSFSWWAAWLNDSAEKVVIAPRMWFSREKMRNISTIDLYPQGWIVL